MADEVVSIELQIEAAKSATTLGDVKKSVEDLREEIEKVEIGSTEFNRLAGAIQTAESRVKTLEKTFEGLEPQQIAESFVKVGEAVAGGFAAAQGAAVLLGDENEALQESLVKAQAAVSIAIGARSIAEGALQARVAARALAEKASALATNASTIATKAATLAGKAFNAVLNANPIVKIVALVGALVTALIGLADNFKFVGDIVEGVAAAFEFLADAAQAVLEFITPQLRIQRELAEERQKEAEQLEANIAATKESIKQKEQEIKLAQRRADAEESARDLEIRLARAAGKSTVELERAKLKANIDRIERTRKQEKALFELRRQQIADEIKLEIARGSITAEREAEISEFLRTELLERQKNINQLGKDLQAARDDLEVFEVEVTTTARNESKKRSKIREDEAKKQAKIEDDAAKKRKAAMEKEAEEQRAAMEKEAADQRDFEEREAEERANQIAKLNELRINAMAEGVEKEKALRNQAFNDELLALNEQGLLTAEIEKELRIQLATDLAAIEDQAEEKRIQDEQDRRDKRLDNIQTGIDLANAAADAFIKDEAAREQVRKTIAVAQIAVDTARAISAAIAAGAGVPFPGNIPAILSGVTAVLSGVAQARSILGESGTVNVGNIGQGAAQGAGGVQIGNVAQTQGTLVDQSQQEIQQKVVIVESEMTDAQNEVQVIEQGSTL